MRSRASLICNRTDGSRIDCPTDSLLSRKTMINASGLFECAVNSGSHGKQKLLIRMGLRGKELAVELSAICRFQIFPLWAAGLLEFRRSIWNASGIELSGHQGFLRQPNLVHTGKFGYPG